MEGKSEKLFEELHPPLTAEQAVFEASRCLECGGPYAQAPCVVACPTHIDIPKFIREIRLGDPQASARTIFEANILGGSCARVCPVEVLCQGACVLNKEGRRPVSIASLQRYATDYSLTAKQSDRLKVKKIKSKKKSVGVIGAGPAGLSCAAELAKLGYEVTVYESRPDFGGLITYGVAPYKQLKEPLPKEVELIEKLGVKFQTGIVVGRDISLKKLEAKHAVIFLGIGLGEDIELKIPGSDLLGVWRSLEFIERLKTNRLNELSGRAEERKRVAVIGGGNTAIDVAREAVRLKAKDVVVLYRRTEKEMPAYAHEVRAAKKEGVQFLWLTTPLKFVGDTKVKAVECIHMRLGAPEADGRPRAEPVPGTEFRLDIDTVILAMGQRSRTEFLQTIEGLEIESGLIKVNERYQTTNEKYFAGGDCVNGGGTVVEAVQHGKLAAHGIHEYLSRIPAPASAQAVR